MNEPRLDLSPSPGDACKNTTCYMCACRCGIKVWLKDGQIRYIQGNPAHPVNRGVLCAKGSAGIMQHYSPARLSRPLLRVGERGSGEFREIGWDEALELAASWLAPIRERNPDELAFFTGRDQSQALTGWWAQQFGTINYAAHGGLCSVNMAAAGLYTLGGSFWEFGEPDWEHTRYLMLWGVAEDHDSNPIKLGLGKLKARGAKIVSINPVRSGYGAIADEWIGIRPGTDGLFAFALIHELLRTDRIDLDYLVRFTNAHWLVIRDPGAADDGMFARDAQARPLCWARSTPALARSADEGTLSPADTAGISPAVVGEYALADGRMAMPVFHLLVERCLDPQYAPAAVAERCGIPAATICRIAQELAQAAFDSGLKLPTAWTDTHGRRHQDMLGRPVAMHAMRGISAHSNGFHTCRALHVLQMLLGAIDAPGSFRYQPPYPRPIPPARRPGRSRDVAGRLDGPPLGHVHGPEDLLVDAQGRPRRIDHGFSWAYPLSTHGLLHAVIRNAWAGDPYRIDTLMLFMANMGWNSAMNTAQTMRMLTDKDATGAYRIPHIIYADAYASETVAYADLVLPDTTYLERHDCISLLDRPISDADGAADAIRHPVFDPSTQAGTDGRPRDVRGFQTVLLDLGARLRLPGMVDAQGKPLYRDYADYMVNHQRTPGVGLLAGWRGADGSLEGKGPPNPKQLEAYIAHGGFWHAPIPAAARYFKMGNRDYLEWAANMGFVANAEPVVLQIYSETLQKFRLAARGHGVLLPPERERERVERYFDPLPFWYAPFEGAGTAAGAGDEMGSTSLPRTDSPSNLPGTDSLEAVRPEPVEGRAGLREQRGSTGSPRTVSPFSSPRTDSPSNLPGTDSLETVRPELVEGHGGMREKRGSTGSPRTDSPSSSPRTDSPSNSPGTDFLETVRPEPVEGHAGMREQHGSTSTNPALDFPLYAITQRPMFMYHAWGSQNAWLRQIAARNVLYVHPQTAARFGIADGEMAQVTSRNGNITVPVRCAANVQPDTVWTWNAIGKRRGAWRLDPDAPEGTRGFLLNHLIDDRTQPGTHANADPVTGQAAWFDLRVRIAPAARSAAEASDPQFPIISVGNSPSYPLRYGADLRKKS